MEEKNFQVAHNNPADSPLADITVHIVGPYPFQNELLAMVIEARTGARCRCIKHFESLPNQTNGQGPRDLLLWDCLDKTLDEFMSEFVSSVEQFVNSKSVVLLNVTPGQGIEDNCVSQGIRGIFYIDDSVSLVMKGLAAVHKGELWFSREVMTKFILEDKSEEIVSMKVRKILTPREIEIISLLAVGCKNEEIADKLCVSPHTIKTHLYNIYKKINVTNRLQATLWAAKNL
jgi:DNA-binding NarL/FixJ family response regulator